MPAWPFWIRRSHRRRRAARAVTNLNRRRCCLQQDDSTVRAFLAFLGVEHGAPNLPLLNRLIRQHQLKVPFETLTKLIDYQRACETGRFLPGIDEYVRRVTTRGGGGTCWSLARGFGWLLSQMGFEAHYMIMEPGHVCVRVELDQPYYVDVGYAVPLYRAYPLNESFEVADARCRYRYEVADGAITTEQTPGPRKVLDATPRSFEEFGDRIIAANQWTEDSFLMNLSIFTYIDGVPTSLKNGVLKRYLDDGLQERGVSDEEALEFIEHRFGMDPQIYLDAKEIRAEYVAERRTAT